MARREVLTLAACASTLFLAGCSVPSMGLHQDGHSRASPLPTLTTYRAVIDAAETGPGVLNYCPMHDGSAPAKFSITLPGTSRAGGWCQTSVSRTANGTDVTFRAHWNARREIGRAGTMTLKYFVPNPTREYPTPGPSLVGQSGMPPP